MKQAIRSRDEVMSTLRENRERIFTRYKVRRMGVFGSYARGEQNEKSDIDIMVDIDPSVGLEFIAVAEELEKLLGIKVDLVSERAVKPGNRRVFERELIDV